MTQRIASGGPWEERYGYARAVVSGSHVWVSGCTSVVGGEVRCEGDPAAQARTAFEVGLAAVEQAGFGRSDVVRTRMFVVDLPANGDAVAGVHGELFATVRPASTIVGVVALVDSRLLVEVELEAHRESP